MNPGKMDRRITIQARTLTKDAAGGRVETWADSFLCWAELVKTSQTETVTADADRNIEIRQFRIRYKSGLASGTHRILYQLRFYDITGIDEEGRQDRLLLTCRATQSLTNV
jgi:SPP1 family predicted phage head-tail adaptor